MGLSSSQARLLSLTGRMHDIEYKAQKLEAQKLQMANESTHVYQEYENSLNKSKIQFKKIHTDGSIGFVDATYNVLKEAGYKISYVNGAESYNFTDGDTSNLVSPVTQKTTVPDGYTAIRTAGDLTSISGNGNYILMNDIDLTGTSWSTISSFSGTLDGNGYVIKGLNNTFINNLNGGTVKNLGIEEANVNRTSSAILATYAKNNATIENCYIKDSSMTGGYGIAAIAYSLASNSTINNCYVESTDFDCLGYGAGVMIHINDSTGVISNSYVKDVNINNSSASYGIAGAPSTIENCYIIDSNIISSSNPGNCDCIGYGSGTSCTNVYYVNSGTSYLPGTTEYTHEQLNAAIANGTLPAMATSSVAPTGFLLTEEMKNSPEWLSNMIEAGFIVISKPDGEGSYIEVNVATDTNLQEVSNEID